MATFVAQIGMATMSYATHAWLADQNGTLAASLAKAQTALRLFSG